MDGIEVNAHRTDPNVGDSDTDGLGDWEEVEAYKTNPLLRDSEGDGSLDLIEVEAGINPNGLFDYPKSGYNHAIGETNLKRPIITVPPMMRELSLVELFYLRWRPEIVHSLTGGLSWEKES